MKARHTPRTHSPALWLVALAAFVFTRAASAGEAPRIDALRAAKIATEYLSTLGPTAPYIVSLTLDKTALAGGRSSWVARWSASMLVEGEREIGLRVNLDGSTARLVEGKPAAQTHRLRVGGP